MRHSDIIVEDLSKDFEEIGEREDGMRAEAGRGGNPDRGDARADGRKTEDDDGDGRQTKDDDGDGRRTEDDDGDGEKQEFSIIREILSWVVPFGLALLAGILLKTFVVINADVPTGSMENTIMPGDRLIGNRLAYLRETPERGDVVIFRYPDNEADLYVKRVIGLPGESVDIHEGQIYIDGAEEPLSEPYLKETWTVATGDYHFEIPQDAYLMLGDNRNDSWDARYWKNTYVYGEKILGKAMVIYWPLSDIGKLE